MSRVGVFVDVGNQYFCINKKCPGKRLNYKRYLEYIKEMYGELHKAFAYGTQIDGQANKFIDALKYMGYETVFRPVDQGFLFFWDAGMTVDMLRLAEKLDVIVIGSASRNFAPVIEHLKGLDIKVIVLACGVSKELKDVASRWTEIPEDMLDEASTAA